jgi:hypothetical protein
VQPHDLQRTLHRLEPTGWSAAARRFAARLRTAGHAPGRLLVVGTPEHEPWHLAAHLADAARWQRTPALDPVLVRWQVPAGAPPHLSVDLSALHRAGRGATVLVSAPAAPDDRLLDRLDDARSGGALLLALHAGSECLEQLAHEALSLPAGGGLSPAVSVDTAVHALAVDPQARRGTAVRWRSWGARR